MYLLTFINVLIKFKIKLFKAIVSLVVMYIWKVWEVKTTHAWSLGEKVVKKKMCKKTVGLCRKKQTNNNWTTESESRSAGILI